jgi:hypothetical protein
LFWQTARPLRTAIRTCVMAESVFGKSYHME